MRRIIKNTLIEKRKYVGRVLRCIASISTGLTEYGRSKSLIYKVLTIDLNWTNQKQSRNSMATVLLSCKIILVCFLNVRANVWQLQSMTKVTCPLMHESDINAKNKCLKGSRSKCYNYKQLVCDVFFCVAMKTKIMSSYLIWLGLVSIA